MLRGKLTGLDRKTTEPIATQTGLDRRPLDLLAREMRVELAPDKTIKLRIFTADRRAVTMGFDLDNLHLFCEVLRKGTDRAGWDLDLKLPWETPATPMPAARA